MKTIFKPIQLESHNEYGLILKLDSWEHRDYIEDVLVEKFHTEINTISESTIFFDATVDVDSLQKAIEAINLYHSKNQSLYPI